MPSRKHTTLLIIGAGPFGLAMAAYARHHQIDYLVAGRVMEFWKSHMPEGMYLRSGCDWHYDPANVHTIERYLETRNLKPADVDPFPQPKRESRLQTGEQLCVSRDGG